MTIFITLPVKTTENEKVQWDLCITLLESLEYKMVRAALIVLNVDLDDWLG